MLTTTELTVRRNRNYDFFFGLNFYSALTATFEQVGLARKAIDRSLIHPWSHGVGENLSITSELVARRPGQTQIQHDLALSLSKSYSSLWGSISVTNALQGRGHLRNRTGVSLLSGMNYRY